MPTTPPRNKRAPQRATAAKRGGPSGKAAGKSAGRKPGKSRKPWWSSPWFPLGHLVAGVAISVGFHVTYRLWDQTKTYEPLDLSPPFAAKPLPGTSLDSLMRRYGNQLSPLLNPTPSPDNSPPPPLVLTQDSPANNTTPGAPAPSAATPVAPTAPAAPPRPCSHRSCAAHGIRAGHSPSAPSSILAGAPAPVAAASPCPLSQGQRSC